MEIAIASIVAFLVSILTFFSGFGLGTLLTPVLMVFFPVEIAIALTGVVHFFNNLFKIFLVGRHAVGKVLIRFGIPAILAAFLGSWLLINLPDVKPIFTYEAFRNAFEIYPVKLLISLLLIVFATLELIPKFKQLTFSSKLLPFGGFLSGFFGGLSGNQGALRSAFLIKAGLSKEAFIGTAVVVSTFVDFTRLGVYATKVKNSGIEENLTLVIFATASAIIGAFLGRQLLKKVTLELVQTIVAIMLILLSAALGLGFI